MIKTGLQWVAENWVILVVLIAIIVMVVVAVRKFLSLPTSEQTKKVKECLLAWVVKAETELGGGTGPVKLRTVYGWFVTAFPFLKNFIPFETFSEWVDEALDQMKEMLATNDNLKQVVEGNTLVSVETTVTTEDTINVTTEEN